ncbi:MAG: nuclear transport factor 2 family protein [Myxococcota bacterium]
MKSDAVARWHEVLGEPETDEQLRHLDALLHDDVVFHSPVLHRPVEGKMATSLYLQAAARVLVNDHWRYVRELLDGPHAALEFITEVDGLVVNGIDLITFDDEERIIDFKVMIRPFRAIEKLKQKMAEMMQALQG